MKAPINAVILCAFLGACASPTASKVAAPSTTLTNCMPQKMVFYFGSWETALNELSQKEITMVQSKLTGCSIDSVQIIGMAGAPGDVEANMDVSRKRAEIVADALAAGRATASRSKCTVRKAQRQPTA